MKSVLAIFFAFRENESSKCFLFHNLKVYFVKKNFIHFSLEKKGNKIFSMNLKLEFEIMKETINWTDGSSLFRYDNKI